MRQSIVSRATIAVLLGMALTLTVRAAGAAESTPIPATSAEIWRAIDSHVQELHAAVAKGKLTTVHVDAFVIRDLTRGLSTHSQDLPETVLAALLGRNHAQAVAFGFQGTPAFIIGHFRIPGALDAATFKQAIADARAAQQRK